MEKIDLETGREIIPGEAPTGVIYGVLAVGVYAASRRPGVVPYGVPLAMLMAPGVIPGRWPGVLRPVPP